MRSIFFETPSIEKMIFGASSGLAMVGQRLGFRGYFKPPEHRQGLKAVFPTHCLRRPQAGAKRRALRAAEDRTAKIGQQLHATDARGFTLRHAGNRRSDRGRDATRAATGTAVHAIAG